MDIENQRRIAAILGIIADAEVGVGSTRISTELHNKNLDIKERMVRYYLEEMDKNGFTSNLGRRGRVITELGRKELQRAVAIDRVGFVSASVDELSYKTTYNLQSKTGTIVLNLSSLPYSSVDESKSIIRNVIGAGLGMGRYFRFNSKTDSQSVEVGSICSITLNGIFRSNGIPMTAKFGGLLEVANGFPKRFTQIINYDGTTLDPIEIFIKGKMTNVLEAAETGNGIIGAGFREIPAAALPLAKQIISTLERQGLCSVLLIGEAGRPLLDVPIMPGRAGIVLAAGLNPIAALEESGIPTDSFAMSMVCNASELKPI